MEYETIKYEKEAGYCLITLNRPERLNALSTKMFQELDMAVDEIAKDDEIKVFIFTGAPRPDGRPCFCAGMDLKEAAERGTGSAAAGVAPGTVYSPVSALWTLRQPRLAMVRGFEKITWCPKVSIAAVDGTCTAGGIELACSCDIILASETARISDMHVKNLGWVGGGGAPVNIAWKIGYSKALELCCTGDEMDGNEAYRIGLANHVFPPDKLLEGAKELATKIGSMRLAAVTMTKAICQATQDMDRKTSLHYNDAGLQSLMAEPDAAEWGPARWVRQR